jgi:hypothetical protein
LIHQYYLALSQYKDGASALFGLALLQYLRFVDLGLQPLPESEVLEALDAFALPALPGLAVAVVVVVGVGGRAGVGEAGEAGVDRTPVVVGAVIVVSAVLVVDRGCVALGRPEIDVILDCLLLLGTLVDLGQLPLGTRQLLRF